MESSWTEITRRSLLGLGLMALVQLWACQGGSGQEAGAGKPEGRLQVVATTTMIGDLAHELGGDAVQVQSIMRPGGDPHLYQPTPSDAKMVARADMVLTNGLKLEGWLSDLVHNAGGKAQVVVLSEGIEPLQNPHKTNYPDPHIWHDVSLWKEAAANLRDALVKRDPAHADLYRERTAAYLKELDALHSEVQEQIKAIPAQKRVLVTSHDAFQYFGRAYGLEVVAVQGLSTESEAGARDLARVIEVVRGRQVPAVFIETSVNPKLMEQISRETGAQIGGTLYSDSLGAEGEPGSSYTGMIRANTQRIVKALGGAS